MIFNSKKNTVNAIVENLMINEVKSVDLGSGVTAYQSNGKYYIKKNDERKEISQDQYDKLLNKSGSNDTESSTSKSGYTPKKFTPSKASMKQFSKVEDIIGKYANLNDTDSTSEFTGFGSKQIHSVVSDPDSLIKELEDAGFIKDSSGQYRIGKNLSVKVGKGVSSISDYKDKPVVNIDFAPYYWDSPKDTDDKDKGSYKVSNNVK